MFSTFLQKQRSNQSTIVLNKFDRLEILNKIEYARYHRRMKLHSPALLLLDEVEKKLNEMKAQRTHVQGKESNEIYEEIINLLIRCSLEKVLNAKALERPLQMMNILFETYENYIQPSTVNGEKQRDEINIFYAIVNSLEYPKIE